METHATRLSPVVRKLLAADAAFEFLVAFLLAGIVGDPEAWLGLGRTTLLIAAGVFGMAGIALAFAAWSRGTNPSFVRQLAWANIAGGFIIWGWLLLAWGSFEPEGRWLVAAYADCFILLGLLEWFALRRTGPAA